MYLVPGAGGGPGWRGPCGGAAAAPAGRRPLGALLPGSRRRAGGCCARPGQRRALPAAARRRAVAHAAELGFRWCPSMPGPRAAAALAPASGGDGLLSLQGGCRTAQPGQRSASLAAACCRAGAQAAGVGTGLCLPLPDAASGHCMDCGGAGQTSHYAGAGVAELDFMRHKRLACLSLCVTSDAASRSRPRNFWLHRLCVRCCTIG